MTADHRHKILTTTSNTLAPLAPIAENRPGASIKYNRIGESRHSTRAHKALDYASTRGRGLESQDAEVKCIKSNSCYFSYNSNKLTHSILAARS